VQLDFIESLDSLGYCISFSQPFQQLARADLVPARVVSHVGSRLVVAGASSARAELSGRLRHQLSPVEQPTVGDWVALAPGAPDGVAIIHHVLPRRTLLVRRAAGKRVEPQAVAANVDVFLVVTSANGDANARRIERYLAAIADSGAEAAVVVNKIDLCAPGELTQLTADLTPSLRGHPVIGVSAATGDGLGGVADIVQPGRTIALVGMSGVGKSSLANRLLDQSHQRVLPIDDNDRGRHATTRRDLLVLPGGGLLIDTPGMRTFGMIEDDGGLAAGFDEVLDAAAACRFRDCRHAGEPGCAVTAAIDDGSLAEDRVRAYHKLEREVAAAELRTNPVTRLREKQRIRARTMALRARGKVDPKLGR
jgi:ribosome biogenesis GTPase